MTEPERPEGREAEAAIAEASDLWLRTVEVLRGVQDGTKDPVDVATALLAMHARPPARSIPLPFPRSVDDERWAIEPDYLVRIARAAWGVHDIDAGDAEIVEAVLLALEGIYGGE